MTACMEACPYEAIAFDWRAGKVRKCDLCHFRVVNGFIPACADNVCLAHCIYFGEQEKISRMIKEKEWLKYRMAGKLGEMIIRVED
ncbi:MAG: 4Fe-4S dicluster domain-containing protein [Bacillota bacterium]